MQAWGPARICAADAHQALGGSHLYSVQGHRPCHERPRGGQVDVLCDQTTNAIPQIEGGKIKATRLRRPIGSISSQAADLEELGLKGVEITVWHGPLRAGRTPKPIVDKLHSAFQKALADENILKRFTDLGTLTFPADKRSPEALSAYLKSEVERGRRRSRPQASSRNERRQGVSPAIPSRPVARPPSPPCW